MKNIYTILVTVEETSMLEKLFNMYRIGLNDWDKTKPLDFQGAKVINYTIVCEENVFTSIVNTVVESRV